MLLYHEKQDPGKKISMYFNCPGALIRPALAVHDTIMYMRPELSTLNLGLATGMVSFLCAAGTRGKRYALPNARFLMQRTGIEDLYRGQASDIGVEVCGLVCVCVCDSFRPRKVLAVRGRRLLSSRLKGCCSF